MILIAVNIVDNFIVMMRGIIFKIAFLLCLLFLNTSNCFALEKVGIITYLLILKYHCMLQRSSILVKEQN